MEENDSMAILKQSGESGNARQMAIYTAYVWRCPYLLAFSPERLNQRAQMFRRRLLRSNGFADM